MSQDPTKAKVIELLREWCDDPPVSVDEAVKVLSELVYPTEAERCEAAFWQWHKQLHGPCGSLQNAWEAAWLAARGHK